MSVYKNLNMKKDTTYIRLWTYLKEQYITHLWLHIFEGK